MTRLKLLAVTAGVALLAASSAQAAPKTRVIAPGAVEKLMLNAKLKVLEMHRNGSVYVVRAKGLSGNEVVVVVDGDKARILGLDVVKWAPGAKRIKRGSRGATFTGDVYEFGVTVPAATYVSWTVYDQPAWSNTSTQWIEVETTVTTSYFEEVTYEESVTEESYEEYSVEYQEAYHESLQEETSSYEEASESEAATVEETSSEESSQAEESGQHEESGGEDADH